VSEALSDVLSEADRVLELSSTAGATVRLIGGVAVAQHRHVPEIPALARAYADIDLVVHRGHDRILRGVLESNGYTPNKAFNSLRGDRRLLYYDEPNGRQIDVFVGQFLMCHHLDLDDRLSMDPQTLAPADLLLTKLQIVQLNPKDTLDALALLHQHEVGEERSGDVMGVDRLIHVTSHDWGWYTTFTDNLAAVAAAAPGILPPEALAPIGERIESIGRALTDSKKSLSWKARARVGRRIPWYELPEEVRHGGVEGG
jgi:hypothetical protein